MTTVEEVLEHHGVKGMHWGQHKAKVAAKKDAKAKASAAAEIQKGDDAWEKRLGKRGTQMKIYNAGARELNDKHTDAFNDKWDKTGKPYGKEYYDEYSKMAEKVFQKAADDYAGPSASGKLKVKAHYDVNDGFPVFEIVETKVAKHAEGTVRYKGVLNPNKSIKKLVPMDDVVAHSEVTVEDILAHHGVKGMKWGVHKKHESNMNRLASKVGAAEDHAGDVHAKVKAENKAKGMNSVKAGRKAFDDPRSKRAEKAADKADAALRKAGQDRKSQIKNERAKQKARYQNDYLNQHGRGERFVKDWITAGAYSGYHYQRAAGYSKGATLATTLVAGPVGNVAAARIASTHAITDD